MPEPSAPTALSPGSSRVDQAGRRYELVRELGSGGFGTVWLARMHNPGGLSQAVALKILRERPDARSQALERLMDEALVLSNLRHPVIVAAFDLARFDREVALVTEYVEGRDLGECLELESRTPQVPAGAVLEVVGQVASALDDAWTRLQIVHRDVKPANIRIGRHGTVKLLDFGIARSALPRSAETGTNLVVGSLPYLAPERYKHRDPHPASDVYALGCVLYEGLTGARLVDGLETAEIIGLGHDRDELEALVERRLADPPAPTPETTSTVLVRAPFPVTVRELLREMLAFDPTQRPPASEVARRAERAQDALPDRVGLRTYCRSLTWPDDGVPTGPSPVSPDVTTAPSPPAAGPPVRSPSSAPETLALTTSGVTDRAPPVRTRWLGLGAALGTVGLAGSGGIALVLLLAAAVMLALSEPWWSAQEPTPALRPAPPRRDAPAPPPVPVDPPAPAPTGPAPSTPHAPPAAAPPPDAPPVEVPPVDPPPESPGPPSAPDPAPAAPAAGSVTLRLSDPGPYTSVTVNCKDGTRGRAALSQGVAVVGGLPPAGASCTAFFVGGATQPSVPVVVGADLTCQRGVKLTCWGSPPR